ncbi:MAG: HNH endonuclease [Sphingobacteriaceae bacterium]|nr:HNH endonuclease [Sphingobacteriaceae bacterium]
MFGCFKFIKNADKTLRIFFKNIPLKTDINILVDVIIYYSKGYDKYLNDLFSAVQAKSMAFLESGEIYLDFYMYRKEDIMNLGACIDMIDERTKTMLLRIRNSEDVDNFIKFLKLSDSEKTARIDEIIEFLLQDKDCIFNPKKAKQAVNIDIPASFRGLAPDYDTIKDILFKGNPVIYKFKDAYGILKIKYSSVRDIDFRLAYEKLGMSTDDIKKIEDLYVWHHLDDWDPVSGEGTMQLVLKSLHNSTGYDNALNHTGGVALWKWYYLIYYS